MAQKMVKKGYSISDLHISNVKDVLLTMQHEVNACFILQKMSKHTLHPQDSKLRGTL